jgi:hypothetical protein
LANHAVQKDDPISLLILAAGIGLIIALVSAAIKINSVIRFIRMARLFYVLTRGPMQVGYFTTGTVTVGGKTYSTFCLNMQFPWSDGLKGVRLSFYNPVDKRIPLDISEGMMVRIDWGRFRTLTAPASIAEAPVSVQ